MLLEFLRCLLLTGLLLFGLGWPLASRLPLAPAEKLAATLAGSLIVLWGAGWLIYTTGLPWNLLWLLPVLAAWALVRGHAAFAAVLRDPVGRGILAAQGLVALWCVGWLALVQNYSGGGWTSDWFEHWERAAFFLQRGATDHLFLDVYALTARPPLANIVTAAWLHLTAVDFPHYQLFCTLLGSLTFLPAAVLLTRWRTDAAAPALLAVLFMVNPLFVQNAVFSWTKLPTALLVLTALHFFLRSREGGAPWTSALLFSTCLAAAVLAHYSAAPYAVALALGWLIWRPQGWSTAAYLRVTTGAVVAAGLFLATWFGWAIATYGVAGTLGTNTSVTTVASDTGGQLMRVILNLRDTLVPHFLRAPDPALIAQTSPWGYARDWFFQCYQLNLPLACGSVGWLVILRELGRQWTGTAAVNRRFWVFFVAIVLVLGVAAHGARDLWGLTHICLHGLVLLGVVVLAARWPALGRGWRLAAIGGATLDLVAGIGLHFAVQNHALDRWLTPERTAFEIMASYNPQTLKNLIGLMVNRLDTFHNAFAPSGPVTVGLLGVVFAAALWRACCRR